MSTLLPSLNLMFDICSSDNWVTLKFAESIKAKNVGTFKGFVKTINGKKRATLPKFEIKLRKQNGDFATITCLGISEISWRPKIEARRLHRLCNAFNIPPQRVDTSSGEVNLLIGLRQQSVQAFRHE